MQRLNHLVSLCSGLCLGLSLLAAPAVAAPPALKPAAKPAVPQSLMQVQMTFAPVVKRVAPAVVNVYTRTVVQAQVNPLFNDPMFQRFFGVSPEMRQRVQQSLGSGVIVRPDGTIITNNHVVQGGQNIVVVLADKREFKAKLVHADPRTDLAVLKIDVKGEKLPTIPFGDSDRLNVGDIALAIGDPFGVGQTVTMGIISALSRTAAGANDYQFFIQTDAAVNPGNSGGALVTMDGRLAGINTAIVSRTGQYAGIGFAIPSNLVRRVLEGSSGGAKLPWVGASGQPVTPSIASSIGLPRPGGVLLKSVNAHGAAGKAGLKTGDVILSVNGTSVDDMQSLNYRIATHKAGDVVKLHVYSNGKKRDVDAKLTLAPEDPPRQTTSIAGRNPMTGAKIENLSPATVENFGLDDSAKGVVVSATTAGTPSENYGFQRGDIVMMVNGTKINRVADLTRALEAAQGQWNMIVIRDGRQMQLSVRG
ncbi:MAG TPA: Do family serine endopeptidase [Rhizomicrobium sp.]|nr:Do family serine endopeptidase [Rhizomicrobium sp.]